MIGSKSNIQRLQGAFLILTSRYNIKRRVASLPPISSEVFAEKVITAQATTAATAAKAAFERACNTCQKTYYSENAYQNHLGSQKHQSNVAAAHNGSGPRQMDDETGSVMSSTFSLGEPVNSAPSDPIESVDPEAEAEFSKVVNGIKEATITEDEPVSRRPTRPHHSAGEQRSEHPLSPIAGKKAVASSTDTEMPSKDEPIIRCLFCNYDSPTFKLNVHHMSKFHGMFIPEQTYLVDLEGLITYLHEKISENHECLACHKLKNSMSGIQIHMRDKGHCMIAFGTEEEKVEIGQFYDFTSTYSDHDDDEEMADHEDEADGGVKVGLKGSKTPKTVVEDASGDHEMDDVDEGLEGWETDEEEDEGDEGDEGSTKEAKGNTERPTAIRRFSITDYHPNPRSPSRAAYSTDFELHLPGGRTAGHRSLARYYRQNLHAYPTPAERVEQRAIEDGRAGSGSDEEMPDHRGRQMVTRANGGLGMIGVTDAKKREVQAVEKRDTKMAQRAQKQYQWSVDKKGNQQKHFRDPLLQ